MKYLLGKGVRPRMQVKLVSWSAWGSLVIKLNGMPKDEAGRILLEVEAGTTVGELIEQLGIPDDVSWLIGVNDELKSVGYELQPNDRLSLLLPIGGG